MFQAEGPATEKALSPKPVLVLGTSKEPDLEDLRVARPCNDDIGARTSMMYSRLVALESIFSSVDVIFIDYKEVNISLLPFGILSCLISKGKKNN